MLCTVNRNIQSIGNLCAMRIVGNGHRHNMVFCSHHFVQWFVYKEKTKPALGAAADNRNRKIDTSTTAGACTLSEENTLNKFLFLFLITFGCFPPICFLFLFLALLLLLFLSLLLLLFLQFICWLERKATYVLRFQWRQQYMNEPVCLSQLCILLKWFSVERDPVSEIWWV